MEWNIKWEWGNNMMFCSKACESPKELQLTDWGVDEAGEFDGGIFSFSGVDSIGVYGSDLGRSSSIKSSISACTDSSPNEGVKPSNFTFEACDDSHGNLGNDVEQYRVELSRHSPSMEALIGYDGLFPALKLGKRTFESNSGESSVELPSFSIVPVSSVIAAKKTKSSSQNALIPSCQVEGCNLDLSSAKEYHRKHRVCHCHSKCPKVIIGGVERRFCQQCSRFHSLSDFDEKKQSCRRRLSDHNARRRKPQQETIQFNSTRLSSWFYGVKETMFSLSMGVAPELPRALSLLSNKPSSEPEFISTGHSMHVNQISMAEQVTHAIPQSLPFESTEHWQARQPFNSHIHTFVANGHSGGSFQGIQLSKDPFDDFYVNGLN